MLYSGARIYVLAPALPLLILKVQTIQFRQVDYDLLQDECFETTVKKPQRVYNFPNKYL